MKMCSVCLATRQVQCFGHLRKLRLAAAALDVQTELLANIVGVSGVV